MIHAAIPARISGVLRLVLAVVAIATSAAEISPARAQPEPPKYDVKAHYRKTEHLVPMRDGVRLYTVVYEPREAKGPLPFLMARTPYGCKPYGPDEYRKNLGPSAHSAAFEEDGFLFVFQDVRGKYRSEGDFVVMRPHRPDKTGTQADESSDTYDTIDWLLKNIPNNNGRVGMIGTSYPGFQVVHGMIDAHPALKAASPQASPLDMFLGDDFHHNGAFRLAYSFLWLAGNAQTREGPIEANPQLFKIPYPDGYQFFLDLVPLSRADTDYFHGKVPTWNEYMEHPDYDRYWEDQNFLKHLKDIKVPTLHVAGWFDAEDFYGPMAIYAEIEKTTPDNRSTLIVGPYSHGGWNSHVDGNTLGNVQFAGAPSTYFRDRVQFPFFQNHLKGDGEAKLPEVLAFETGANAWRSFDHWPPREQTEDRKLYFRAGGKLSFEPPREQDGSGDDAYVSDPRKPVPATAQIRFGNGHDWMVEDQRFAGNRPDVLVYESDPLTEDLILAGLPVAKLFASSSGTDSDFVVKLIDVYPDDIPDGMGGYVMLLSGEVFRAKYRESFSKPKPLVPGEPVAIEINLLDKYHRFLKGHKIMVQVQSTWFPIIDVNPGLFGDTYHVPKEQYQTLSQKVYRRPGLASHVVLPIMAESPGEYRGPEASPKAEETPVPAPAVVNAEEPKQGPADPIDGPPFVTAKAWVIVDGKTGEVLGGKDESTPLPMASTTKIMTALVVLRLAAEAPAILDEMVTFSPRADDTTGSSSEVKAGERLPVRELLYGLLLPSGNDASVALGEHFGGRLDPPADSTGEADPLPRFIAEMNRMAKRLGLAETHFANTHGLTADGHHASPRDLAKLARLALKDPAFVQYVSTAKRGCALVDAEGHSRNVVWTNTNRLLATEGYDGVKTGTTNAAGACLVASGRRNGDHRIVVILGATSADARYTDARNLFRWAWQGAK